ncbi:hypothetical protein [Novosphingobium nitrogenifigens]|uniref:hypothetical protein n=1 Tax=Novosphingobium nitrogenifigens TaxID=378548 RepID=UPI0012F8ABB6|nr:hypothetical protein [Novosphingobium nitrogenifigens]
MFFDASQPELKRCGKCLAFDSPGMKSLKQAKNIQEIEAIADPSLAVLPPFHLAATALYLTEGPTFRNIVHCTKTNLSFSAGNKKAAHCGRL